MKFKELCKMYPGYRIIESGYPGCAPFTCLPPELRDAKGAEYDAILMECEVKAHKAIERTGAHKRKAKGVVYAYLSEGSRP